MLDFIIKTGLSNGFEVVDVFRKKTEQKIFEYLVDFNAYHQVFEDGSFVRAFWSTGEPIGFYLSNPSESDIKKAFFFGASKIFPEKKKNYSHLLPKKIVSINPDIFDNSYYNIDEDEFLNLIERINDAVLMFPKLRLIKVVFQKLLNKSYIINSFGLNSKYKKTIFKLNLSLIHNGNLIDINETSPYFSNMDSFRLVTRAYNILNSFSDKHVNKKYDYMVLSPESVISILRVFSQEFKGGIRFNKDKLLSPSLLNLVDNSLLDRGAGSVCFDDEGVQSKEFYIIRKGVYQGNIQNIENAFKENQYSTGNGFRIKDGVFPDLRFTNLYIKPGLYPINKILYSLDKGLIVSTLKLREKRGDVFYFSGFAYDFKNNEMKDNFKIEMRMNFFDFFKNIVQVSKEIKFFYSDYNIGSPYLVMNNDFLMKIN